MYLCVNIHITKNELCGGEGKECKECKESHTNTECSKRHIDNGISHRIQLTLVNFNNLE